MSTGVRLRGVALRDQVAAVLRDAAPMALSPGQISQAVGPYEGWSRLCWLDNADLRSPLHTLERRGLVERHTPPRAPVLNPQGAHYWRWLRPASDVYREHQ